MCFFKKKFQASRKKLLDPEPLSLAHQANHAAQGGDTRHFWAAWDRPPHPKAPHHPLAPGNA